MKVLHVAPTDYGGGALVQTLRLAGEDGENVLRCLDDFSCGPISPLTPASRAAWWGSIAVRYREAGAEVRLVEFWKRLDAWDGKLVLWYGRGSALELCLLHLLADRLKGRGFSVVDVTGLRYHFTRYDGAEIHSHPARAASRVREEGLRMLLGTEREVSGGELAELSSRWRTLVDENAMFRVVSGDGLVSAPVDYFDQALLECASDDWASINRLIGEALGHDKVDMQVGDVLLRARTAALVDQGHLVADGDTWENCRVRLPGP